MLSDCCPISLRRYSFTLENNKCMHVCVDSFRALQAHDLLGKTVIRGEEDCDCDMMIMCKINQQFVFITFVNLVPPVPIGTLGNNSPLSAPVTGNPPCIMPAHLHLISMSSSPSLPPAALWLSVYYHTCWIFSWQSECMSSQFPSPLSDHVGQLCHSCTRCW